MGSTWLLVSALTGLIGILILLRISKKKKLTRRSHRTTVKPYSSYEEFKKDLLNEEVLVEHILKRAQRGLPPAKEPVIKVKGKLKTKDLEIGNVTINDKPYYSSPLTSTASLPYTASPYYGNYHYTTGVYNVYSAALTLISEENVNRVSTCFSNSGSDTVKVTFEKDNYTEASYYLSPNSVLTTGALKGKIYACVPEGKGSEIAVNETSLI